ncbi:hypothetical protein PT974_01118 [Cladobotryum mycophilum]|uniref:Zn(2)-C6 fungal-type domain-containing protein n=1 Tax=Cladobotryum mycophilum TaxID=491253 RepID=A0ABR0T434_9HYPO
MEARVSRIIRTRTGCFTCRRRKKKCDEQKPICGGCTRNRFGCDWPTHLGQARPRGRSVSSATPATVSMTEEKQVDSQTTSHVELNAVDTSSISVETTGATQQYPLIDLSTPITSIELAIDQIQNDAVTAIIAPLHQVYHIDLPAALPNKPMMNEHFVQNPNFFVDMKFGIPASMSMLPSHNHDSHELLGYYLSRTVNSMGNGSTDINPFIAKLVPLAFSNPLLMQLILAQSAAHRQASKEPMANNAIAQVYYTDSLRMFRHVVSEHVAGKDGNMLVLTVGSLIMSLTEVARGDKCGSTFGHIAASKSLLTTLLNSSPREVDGELADFLVEYYVHMAAASIISADEKNTLRPLLSPEIEGLAKRLTDKKYVGQLCGSWLQLLLLIPQIFALGQNMLTTTSGHLAIHSADDIIAFGLLQSQILEFVPAPNVNADAYLAGLVFKQAALLYLWSILGTPQQKTANDSHKRLMESAVFEAISLLDQFPASARVNTSLCWPLAIVGCCTSDPAVQNKLRIRLKTMLETIGLGNMRETLALLEHIWKQPAEETSPWTLCKSMQEHQTWISFA